METSSIAEASCMGVGATVRRGSCGYVLPLDTGALRRPQAGPKTAAARPFYEVKAEI